MVGCNKWNWIVPLFYVWLTLTFYLQIASAMVACTFLSAPLMFASAKMVIASNLDPSEFMKTLNLFEFDISVLSSLAAVSPSVASMSFPVFIGVYLSLAYVACLCSDFIYLWLALLLIYCFLTFLFPAILLFYCFLIVLFIYNLCLGS